MADEPYLVVQNHEAHRPSSGGACTSSWQDSAARLMVTSGFWQTMIFTTYQPYKCMSIRSPINMSISNPIILFFSSNTLLHRHASVAFWMRHHARTVSWYIDESRQARNLIRSPKTKSGRRAKKGRYLSIQARKGWGLWSNQSVEGSICVTLAGRRRGSNLLDLLGGDAGRRGRRADRSRGQGHRLLHRQRSRSLPPSSSFSVVGFGGV